MGLTELDPGLIESFVQEKPFEYCTKNEIDRIKKTVEIIHCNIGCEIIPNNKISEYIYYVLEGEIRLLSTSIINDDAITVTKLGARGLVGWVSLLRGKPTEWVITSRPSVLIKLPITIFMDLYRSNKEIENHFDRRIDASESREVHEQLYLRRGLKFIPFEQSIYSQLEVTSVKRNETLNCDIIEPTKHVRWVVSCPHLKNYPIGSVIERHTPLEIQDAFNLKIRLVAFPEKIVGVDSSSVVADKHTNDIRNFSSEYALESVGIKEEDTRKIEERFPFIKGGGPDESFIAVCEMLGLYFKVPINSNNIKRTLDSCRKKNKELSLQLIGALLENIGLTCNIHKLSKDEIEYLDFPVVLENSKLFYIIYGKIRNSFIVAEPGKKLAQMDSLKHIIKGDEVNTHALQVKRSISTPNKVFGWDWFFPLLKKYKTSLILVFAAALLSQLFGLGIPLLIQQIIDKVLVQGNISSLNILGTLMIVFALVQAILTTLQQYLFVDTTDRMDLALGSSVIDRMMSLPLRFFEKRTVGDLSQRINELNTIRSFSTGTAITSGLNIVFSVIYLSVMIAYSPQLTLISLSTLPIYVLLIIFVAPLYREIIRKRAVAQSTTQSHLIEILSGIQTVKSQHMELISRWKWQDRYKKYVDEGFKGVALGTVASQIGNFLNQLSGLLVLWIGMQMVLKSELTLGQLIAFRIIASNATGPLLQLSSLYQGFQGVQLAMERLSDVLDQSPEYNKDIANQMVPLPSISGDVEYKDVSFSFDGSSISQVDRVSFTVNAGSFVGFVGQSGSGKSTTLKLLSKLYNPDIGKIYIDGYDIDKVDLNSLRSQVGIVPQDSLLFEGSINQNIALNEPGASYAAIVKAAKISCAHDFIMELPEGYATILSERGANLSGGQRQRIAIARTILSNPSLIVMDEATSALDFETESRLCKNLQEWGNGKTIFFITHRLETIKDADLIVVMSGGQIREKGTHADLIRMNGIYKTLYSRQSSTN